MEVAITQVRHQPQEALPQAPQPKTGKITGGNGNAGAGGLKVESQLTNGMTLQDQDTQRKYDDGRDLEKNGAYFSMIPKYSVAEEHTGVISRPLLLLVHPQDPPTNWLWCTFCSANLMSTQQPPETPQNMTPLEYIEEIG